MIEIIQILVLYLLDLGASELQLIVLTSLLEAMATNWAMSCWASWHRLPRVAEGSECGGTDSGEIVLQRFIDLEVIVLTD